MPPRSDIGSILIIGSGPINIGQACEFDYSGSQACRALRKRGYRVILVNSNPATIMTDPEWADVTYIEPLDATALTEVISAERPDALLPTLGGQTALNLAVELAELGVLDRHDVELIGADISAIRRAEDREVFRDLMAAHGLDVLDGVVVSRVDELRPGMAPAVVRPAFTHGGSGSGHATTDIELAAMVEHGVSISPVGQVLVEASVKGWSEFELEVMCDVAGSCIVVCSIENIDPVGVHTGDSWTVAPQQTLPDPEYQRMRDAAFACVRAVGVATGGANVQFAFNHETGDMRIIEMNPRASRSSALSSKATGYPIAKLAALLAVGFTLEELPNDITGKTTAAFEPALDYVAVKAPRFDFMKFGVDQPRLGTQMQSVGEALGIGRTFEAALLKALDGLEDQTMLPEFTDAHPYFRDRVAAIREAMRCLADPGDIAAAKRFGLADTVIAEVLGLTEEKVRLSRRPPTPMAVDSCAAEFEATIPYFYLSYEDQGLPLDHRTGGRPVLIIGSGPNRIGQGIEFDYSCVKAAQAFKALGHQVVMLNSNPETVSTDYDTSDRLYLDSVTREHVLDVCELEQPLGVVVTLGGQTPLSLAADIAGSGHRLLGIDASAIHRCEDRAQFGSLLGDLGIDAPEWGRATTTDEARQLAAEIGYPVVVRPDFVLGGSGMRVAWEPAEIEIDGPTLIDRYLQGGIEFDVEILSDGREAWLAGVLEHIEEAGIHSGDSACVIPGPSVSEPLTSEIIKVASGLAAELAVQGVINLQVVLAEGRLFVLEANPRASRTLPFLSKATGLPLVEWACRLMLGERLVDLNLPDASRPTRHWAKEPVFPTDRFPLTASRGAEMRSIGEVMAGGTSAVDAYARALRAAGRSNVPGPVGPPLQALPHHERKTA